MRKGFYLLAKRDKPSIGVAASIAYLRQTIEPIENDFLSLFENDARARLDGRDEDDWPVLPAALGMGCPIWTEDGDFFATGVAIRTTSHVEIYLKNQSAIATPGDKKLAFRVSTPMS